MTPADQEQFLIDAYGIIHDPHERLSAIVTDGSGTGIPDGERSHEALVHGCVSPVWLLKQITDGRLHLRWDAASPLVRGLVGLLCRVYNGTMITDAMTHESQLFAALGLDRQLSPTRLHGLRNVEAAIRQQSP